MGDPKRQTKKYNRPFKPYDKDRLESEKKIMQEHGLRRKKEIWRAQTILKNFRSRARELQASHDEEKVKVLLDKLNGLGMKCSSLDDVLVLGLEDILSRRLETIVHKKGLASTPKQARQLITHGHVYIESRKSKYPGHLITSASENKIRLDDKIKSKLLAEINETSVAEDKKLEETTEKQKETSTEEKSAKQKEETPKEKIKEENSVEEKKEIKKEVKEEK